MTELNRRHHDRASAHTSSSSAAATRARSRPTTCGCDPDVDITLVNPRPKFVERIRLHQFVTGIRRRRRRLRRRARRRRPAGRRHAPSAIDTATRTVQLASGDTRRLRLPHLRGRQHRRGTCIRSRRSRIRLSDSANWSTRSVLRAALDELHPDAPVTVVGGGLTGIETAAELAEQGRTVTLVCGGAARRRRCRARQAAGRSPSGCAKLGVTVLEEPTSVDRGPPGCGGARRRRGAPERADHLDGGLRRAGPGCRAADLRTDAIGPAAHRRDADQRRRPPHRGRR